MGPLPAEVFARCIFDREPKTTVKNALLFSSISSVFHSMINSDPFFREFLRLGDDRFLRYDFKDTFSFKEKYFKLCKLSLNSKEQFPGEVVLGDAVVHEGEVEIFSVGESRSITSYKLKEYPKSQEIVIPEGMLAPLYGGSRYYPIVVRTDKYLAFNSTCDRSVYVFSGNAFRARFDFFGEIYRLHIDKDRLYVVEEPGYYNLEVLDLITCKNMSSSISFTFPYAKDTTICFGKKHMIYIDQMTRGMATDFFALNEPLSLPYNEGDRAIQYFPYQDGFLEVFAANGFIHLAEISIGIEVERKLFAENISEDREASFHFQGERLFIIYASQVMAYHLLTKEMKDLGIVHKGEENAVFESRLLCTTGKAFYVSMEMGNWGNGVEVKSHLTTFAFSKI